MSRGPKPKQIIKETWSPELAYVVGLLTTDGCLLPGHAIDLTSKDKEQLENFKKCTGITNKIGLKNNGRGTLYFRIQFRNVFFYNFLVSIGLTPAKSKTLGPITVPKRYFFDFLRGLFDGDGYSYSYWDKRWRSSFMFYLGFVSASNTFILWLQGKIFELLKIKGHITSAGKEGRYFQLKYAKADGMKILKNIYHSKTVVCLSRKRLKIEKMLAIVRQSRGTKKRIH